MLSSDELSLWENIKKTLKPLLNRQVREPVSFPKRLRVNGVPERVLMTTLDLHGLTVQEAYQTLRRFLMIHCRENTKNVTIITGKGSKEKEGLIHREIKNWLDTPFFQEKIIAAKWLNGGGALELHLRRRK
ncbi:MAG: Smr/MutS family protein [Alphaproteobacteria bacterium]|nr:Smr/MutS family protein [Alphaproteobacteria bacterium]